MKTNKKSKFFALVITLLITGLSCANTFASGPNQTTKLSKHRNHGHHNGKRPGHHHNGNTVAAPLDGGILTILLGGAGAAYFATKKRRKEQ